MPEIFIPAHQFEIRFKKLVNINDIISEKVAPFGKLASDITIENEGTRNVICNLVFENYLIHLRWDRILIRYECNFESFQSLSKAGSSIETPFLRIFDTIKDDPGFGEIIDILNFSLLVRLAGNNSKDENKWFSDTFLKSTISPFANEKDDLAITVEKNEKGKQTLFTFGPYQGINDLTKRNANPKNKDLIKSLDEKYGQMIDIRINEKLNAMSFAKYKETNSTILGMMEKLWGKQ